MGIDLFKRKVISWFFKPERDGWYVDEKAIDEDTIRHKVFHGDGEIMANYKIKKGQSTEFTGGSKFYCTKSRKCTKFQFLEYVIT